MSIKSTTISLDPAETSFVTYLDDFARQHHPPVECRIAGGWVRDKLLSLPSHDLDVALSIPSGYSFALAFVDFLKGMNVSTGSVGKVAANPEQSKHLETGTTRIMGLECDFVGLRSETYTDSRIPSQVVPGTPFEDASRRDLTINSLFYNVHSKLVEDYTGKGLDDLARKVARTPLPPRQTFHDDPLRVLRCVRFASRFDLTIAEDVMEAMREEGIKAALRTKVSKERVGIEVTKMLQKNPLHALNLIDVHCLHASIFTSAVDPPRCDALRTAQILRSVLDQHVLDQSIDEESLWFAAATSPFRDLTIKAKKEVPAVSAVLSDGLKLPHDLTDSTTNLFKAAQLLDPHVTGRSEIGSTLQLSVVKPWERSIVWAIVMSILPKWKGGWDQNAQTVLNTYSSFVDLIHRLDLPAAIRRPPLLKVSA